MTVILMSERCLKHLPCQAVTWWSLCVCRTMNRRDWAALLLRIRFISTFQTAAICFKSCNLNFRRAVATLTVCKAHWVIPHELSDCTIVKLTLNHVCKIRQYRVQSDCRSRRVSSWRHQVTVLLRFTIQLPVSNQINSFRSRISLSETLRVRPLQWDPYTDWAIDFTFSSLTNSYSNNLFKQRLLF